MNEIIREEIRDIAIAAIDPDSTVNVRRSQVEKAVAKVKSSIAKNGFKEGSPITLRPHPDPTSSFEYEIVAGQCRFKACQELDYKEIPSVVRDLDDDSAIQESWTENEFSSELTISDKAYWIHKIVLRYTGEGRSLSDAREIAAAFFNISPATIIAYHPLIGLPEEAKSMLDEGRLQIQDATVIAKQTYIPKHPEESEQRIMERVNWTMEMDTDSRRAARRAMQKLGHMASIPQLNAEKERILDVEWSKVEVAVPTDLHQRLIDWGEKRGLINVSESVIIRYMITDTLRQSE